MVGSAILSILAITATAYATVISKDNISRHTTHRVRSSRLLRTELTTYHPPVTFETYGSGIDHPLAKRGIVNATSLDAAKSFLENVLSVASHEMNRTSGHEFDGVSHEYFHQVIHGIAVANAVANVAIKDNKITSFGSSFVEPAKVASKIPIMTEQDAIAKAVQVVGGIYNNWPTSLKYFVRDNGHAVLVRIVQVQNKETSEWYEVYVDASNGDVINVIDFVAHTSYRAVPFNLQNPTQGYTLIVNPEDLVASPNGWHTVGTTNTTTLLGNNAASSAATPTTQSSANTFDYPYDPTLSPSQGNNPKAGRVNAFYTVNMCHDFTYRYGFTESSFNFQQNNNGNGGAANDRVIISVQDTSGTSDDNFATPPDGQSPIMRLVTWVYTPVARDQALENDLITHEYGHGVSNRLTGGGTARCLQTTEAGGLGEGWSDTLAEMSELNSATVPDFTLGSWATKTGGIRSYPYSTNMQTNPLTYGSVATRNEVHSIGEVWATMWHEIISALVAKYGFSSYRNNASGIAGNIVAMHLYISAMKLQPCNPTFITARNAIIQADVNKYGGANKCLLWKAFAKRGLGNGATTAKVNNMDLPADCA